MNPISATFRDHRAPAGESWEIEVVGAQLPASKVCGDLFEVVQSDRGTTWIAMGDAAGHGVAAGMMVIDVRRLFSIMLPTNDDPGVMISEINRFVMKRFPTCRFVTLTLLAIDNRDLGMRFATAGQPFYRMSTTGEFTTCDSDNGPVGVFDDDKFATAQAEPLRPGELLLLTSDGFREAINPERAMYGEDRLFSCVRRHQAEPSRQIIESLFADVEQFQAGSEDHDDMTAIVVRLNAKK